MTDCVRILHFCANAQCSPRGTPQQAQDSSLTIRFLFQDERLFFVPDSAWHDTLPRGQTKPDNDVGQPPEYSRGLERGSDFAYVSGLNNRSNGNLPLVADGFTRTAGVYTDDITERGGAFEGDAAIIVRVDGSAKIEKPGRDFRIYEERNGDRVDIFSPAYLGNSARGAIP
jgi:hypothetical protein